MVSLTKKNTPFKWKQECQEAFEDLKRALLGPDIMSFPTDDGLFILDTDASDETIGAVLSQVQLGRERSLHLVVSHLGSQNGIIVQQTGNYWHLSTSCSTTNTISLGGNL